MQKSKVKIYFDSKPLTQGHAVRGIGYYTKNLLEQLKKAKDIQLVDSPEDAQVVHFPYFDLFFNTLKPIVGKRNIVTIFDVIPLIYPKQYPPGIKGKINFLRQKRALSKVDAIITISETSKKDLVRFLDVDPSKIFPIHLAPSKHFRAIKDTTLLRRSVVKYTLPSEFVLYVGDVNYNKNLITLADACMKIDIPLVIVGKQAADESVDFNHPENRSFGEFLGRFRENKKIIRLGFVETEDLVSIYNLAKVYCQPSLYEGFGLPVLEAQACGVPVVASKIQALVEIAKDSCLFVEEFADKDRISVRIRELLANRKLRLSFIKSGLENTKRFSWKKTTEATLKVIL